jgi:two-component system, chemotaxis family, sensor kinase CheA
MDELLEQFLIEGRELVQLASESLIALERDRSDSAHIDSAFRAVHTLKGSAALFDLAPMGRALHEAETLLGAVRDGRLAAGRQVVNTLLECVAVTEDWIGQISRDGQLPDSARLQGQHLEQALRVFLADEKVRETAPVAQTIVDWLRIALQRHARAVSDAWAAGHSVVAMRYVPNHNCFFVGDDPLAIIASIPELIGLHIEPREPWSEDEFDPFTCNLILEAVSTAPIAEIHANFRTIAEQVLIEEASAGIAEMADGSAFQRSTGLDTGGRALRVDAARIDVLIDIVGELIVAKNGLAHLATRAAGLDPRLAQALNTNQAELDRLVGSMHRAIMGMRMIPLSRTFRRFPRLVREIADRLGKDVSFDIHGEEVEADKAIVDGLFEPLLHVLRNAVDHGIEDQATRLARSKPATGRITLDGRREGDQIVISVQDDGPGIDLEKVRLAAKARNLMNDTTLDALEGDALAALIFAPGLSTVGAVTDISGRGVGMDSARMTVEALGGRIVVTSLPETGSTIRLILPQAALVTTVMIVCVGEERYGVPIEAVVETALIQTDHIVPVGSGEAFVLRDRTLPLVRLSALLDLASAPRPAGGTRVLIVSCGDQRVGVEVDAFAERVDVLLRPMTGLLSGLGGILGSALLGDGRVLMILDLPELIG